MRHPLGPEQSTLDAAERQFTGTSKVARHDRQGDRARLGGAVRGPLARGHGVDQPRLTG